VRDQEGRAQFARVYAPHDLGEGLTRVREAPLEDDVIIHQVVGSDVEGVIQLVGGPPVDDTHVMAQLFDVDTEVFNGSHAATLHVECFGPLALIVRYRDAHDLRVALDGLQPALTFSVFSAANDDDATWLFELAKDKAGRVPANQYPMGVGVSWSMQHGGPWPSTTNSAATSVGAGAIDRWLRPVTYQAVPAELLPATLRDDNPRGILQRVDGVQR